MAAFFEGGPIPLLGVTPQVLSNVVGQGLTQIAADQVSTLVGEVFQGSGQSFLAGPGQTLLSNAANNILNIGLSSALGQEISGVSGLDLTNGQQFLASVITPDITSTISANINDSIATALESAGPFGPVLSSVLSNVGDEVGGAINGFFGIGGGGGDGGEAAGEAPGTNRRFPGATSDDPPANYGGNAYTLGPSGGDVTFSLQPANQGPQLQGLGELSNPKTQTAFSNLSYTGTPPSYAGVTYDAENLAKISSMGSLTSSNSVDLSSYWTNPTIDGSFSKETFSAQQAQGWSFICAPEDISWDLANASSRVDIFGTNNPPIVAGTKGMRDLSIGNALVEGFTRGVQIEDKVRALEELLKYNANTSDGFVSVPVYEFRANDKAYGSSSTEQGYFIIKDIKVKEDMRDLSGNATRAHVDISLTQVPAYQVNSGRDQASKVTTGAKSAFITLNKNAVNAQANGKGEKSGPAVPKNQKAATGNPDRGAGGGLDAQAIPSLIRP
jgi:hypothetical protein